MSKIIACIDGSLGTNTVCDYAAWLSQKLNAPLELLHVIDTPKAQAPQDLSGAIGLGSRETLLQELVELEERKGKIELEHGKVLLREAKNMYSKNSVWMLIVSKDMAVYWGIRI